MGGTSHVYVALGRRCVRNYGSDVTVTAKHFRPLRPVYSRLDAEHIVGLTRTTTELAQSPGATTTHTTDIQLFLSLFLVGART